VPAENEGDLDTWDNSPEKPELDAATFYRENEISVEANSPLIRRHS
jgi:hypothetical protein